MSEPEKKKRGPRPNKKTFDYNVRPAGQINHLLKWKQENPEAAAEAMRKCRERAGRKKDQPDGLRAKEAAELRAKVKLEAKIIVEKIAKDQNIDDQYAKEALQTVVEIMRMPGEARNKLTAAKTLLEFTKQKPVSKAEVAVAKAEDFLAAVLAAEHGKTTEE